MFKRVSILVYGVICYAVFFATFLYAIGWVGNLWVPRAIDTPREGPLGIALAIDLALLSLFAVQHSVMARPAFKRAWTKVVPVAAERSTYVLLSSLALIALFYWWQPLGGVVWQVESQLAQYAILGAYAFGWALLLLATFLIDHFDLFGLRQSWYGFRGQPMPPLEFRTPWLYRHVRHPIYLGWLLIFWSAPTMTVGHLVFAIATTAYILIAVQFEEHDLIEAHPEYAEYRKRVPMLIPGLGGRASDAAPAKPAAVG